MTVRAGTYSKKSDADLASMFSSSYDFDWSEFRTGHDVVEAALEIEHRNKSVVNPKSWWRQARADSREFTVGYTAYRDWLIQDIAKSNQLWMLGDIQARLNGASLKRLKVLFGIY